MIELHHERFGTDHPGRDPLLLVHGGAGTIGDHFGSVIPPLAEDRVVVGIELQGHGHTPHAERRYTPEHNANDVVGLLDRLGLERVDVLAFSNGCLTALRLAADAPDRIGRMIIASGFARRDGMIAGFWDQFADDAPSEIPAPLAESYRRIAPDPESLPRMIDLDLTLMREARDWSDAELAAITAPVLFLSGDHDIVRPEHTVDLARRVADGRAALLPTGHGDYLGTSDAGPVDEHLLAATVALLRGFLADR